MNAISTQRVLRSPDVNEYHGLVLAAVILGSLSAILSTFASLATIYLIESMKRFNGCLRLIKWMTWCQFCYDLNFFFVIFHEVANINIKYLFFSFEYDLIVLNKQNTYAYCVSVFLSTFGGISVSLWTNALCVVICYTIVKFRVNKKLFHFFKLVIFLK